MTDWLSPVTLPTDSSKIILLLRATDGDDLTCAGCIHETTKGKSVWYYLNGVGIFHDSTDPDGWEIVGWIPCPSLLPVKVR